MRTSRGSLARKRATQDAYSPNTMDAAQHDWLTQ